MKIQKRKADVVVIGAGPGGMSAAIGAAREGAKVILVERLGYLGGQLSSGLPFLAFMDMQKRQIVGGLAEEMVRRLKEKEGTHGHTYCPFHLSVTNMNQFYARIICFEMVQEYGIELLLHCELTNARVENGRLVSVTVTGKGTSIELEAKVFMMPPATGILAIWRGPNTKRDRKARAFYNRPPLCLI